MIRKYLSTVFINLIVKEKQCIVESFSCKKEKINKKTQRIFNEEELENKFEKYINSLISSHYFAYVSLLFTSIGQGIIPTTNKTDLSKFGVDDSAIILKAFKKSYLYASKSELKSSEVVLNKLHTDMIYSPFVILYNLIESKAKDGFNYQGYSLFVLKFEEYIAILVTKNLEIKFGSYFELKDNKENNEDVTFDLEDDLELDSNDTLEELNFDELDNIKVDDDFNIDESLLEENEENLNTFSIDMQVFEYINNAIKEFYDNPAYESDFINNIIIFEHEKSSKAMHSYIENELLIKPNVYSIDVFKEMLKLSKKDLGVDIDI